MIEDENEYPFRIGSDALREWVEILEYIARDRPSAAESLGKKMEEVWGLLKRNPFLGKSVTEEELLPFGYRYLGVRGYLIFYTFEEGLVFVHRILHGARDRKPPG